MLSRHRFRRLALGSAAAGALALAGMVTAPSAFAQTTESTTFTYQSGAPTQQYPVPAGVTQVTITADGGSGGPSIPSGLAGGAGGEVTATVPVTPGSTLDVVVGGDAGAAPCDNTGCGGPGAGTGGDSISNYSGEAEGGGGGGGGSEVTDASGNPLVVAAGGGGAGSEGYQFACAGGPGGAAEVAGTNGPSCSSSGGTADGGGGGGAGTATAVGGGGSAGTGGSCELGGTISPGSAGQPGSGSAGGTSGETEYGAGGGGGGGYNGGGGGGGGASCPIGPSGGSGGGGGGGDFTASSATDVTIGTSSQAFGDNGLVTISYIATAPVLSPPTGSTLPPATQGQSYSETISATGVPTPTFSATGLPPGLSIDSATGVISGTPTAAATYTVEVTASNAAGSPTATYTLVVNPETPPPNKADLSIHLSGSSSTAKPGASFTYTVTVSNAGPATATNVVTGLATAGLGSVTASGTARHGSIAGITGLLFVDPSLASGASTTYTVTGTVTVHFGVIGAAAATRSDVPDPNVRNNAAAVVEVVR
jgi:hypothetical protein